VPVRPAPSIPEKGGKMEHNRLAFQALSVDGGKIGNGSLLETARDGKQGEGRPCSFYTG
jgi:hypothetical protein